MALLRAELGMAAASSSGANASRRQRPDEQSANVTTRTRLNMDFDNERRTPERRHVSSPPSAAALRRGVAVAGREVVAHLKNPDTYRDSPCRFRPSQNASLNTIARTCGAARSG
jgi:hypothetical protein